MTKKVSEALKHAPLKPDKKALGKGIAEWIGKAKIKSIKIKAK